MSYFSTFSTSGNVPDDWNSWYRECYECGTRYHASEGPQCDCGAEDGEELEVSSSKTVTARKGRMDSYRQEIRKGDRVRVVTGFTYAKNGPRTGYFRDTKRVRKGPAWDA